MPFAPRNSAFARRTALVLAGTACAIGVLAPAPAHAVPVAFAQRMETAAACDPALGHLRLRMDVFGAFGIATSQGDSATFDPANDVPDRHAQGTVYESMGFLCAGRAGVRDGHTFESSEMVGTPVVADGQENRLTSTFRAGDVQVDLDARLDCNIVTECYTFTNRTAAALDELYFYPYMDGDLIFDAGSDNDRGARSLGNPPRLYEFDQGDNPATPTTYLALYADAAESRVTGWEVGGFSESRTRLASVARGCPAVHNAFRDRNLLDVDVNRDLLTDRGDDFTLALRVNVGPLAPGEQSAPFCQHIQWGLGRPCSDEDADGVCAPVDDCPLVPDPAQADRDHDGHGDACDVCPGVADAAQTDTDGDGAGDACDVCPAVADPGQADFDHDGRGDACDNCPTLPNPDQADANHDGRGDVCQNCLPGAVEVCDGADDNCDGQIDENPVGAGDPCVTGQLGVCALGHQVCAAGGLSCVAPAPAADDATCDGLDDDCDGTADEDAVLGDPCATGLPGICAVGARICANGAERCQSPSPTPEVCNGVDDNCDGQIDDAAAGTGEACDTGQPGVCGPGLRVCLAGALRCQGADPSNAPDDTCDGVDDDCDGFVDEDVRPGEACDTGGVGACAAGVRVCTDGGVTCVGADPAAEVCNGIDDNCDGVVDNNPAGLGEACDTGRPGACADGVRVCVAGGLRCDVADPGAPSADDATCDGIDNDCDGQIDEDAALGEACDTGLTGVCAAGLRQCVGGEAACVGGDPAAEICNGLDDNCDGVVDENAAGAGEACDTGRSGACADGVRVCVDGDLRCDGPAPAADDVTCDGLDDNCDGRIDEGAPVGQPCETGQAGVCAAGLRVCEAGAWRCDPQTAPPPSAATNSTTTAMARWTTPPRPACCAPRATWASARRATSNVTAPTPPAPPTTWRPRRSATARTTTATAPSTRACATTAASAATTPSTRAMASIRTATAAWTRTRPAPTAADVCADSVSTPASPTSAPAICAVSTASASPTAAPRAVSIRSRRMCRSAAMSRAPRASSAARGPASPAAPSGLARCTPRVSTASVCPIPAAG